VSQKIRVEDVVLDCNVEGRVEVSLRWDRAERGEGRSSTRRLRCGPTVDVINGKGFFLMVVNLASVEDLISHVLGCPKREAPPKEIQPSL